MDTKIQIAEFIESYGLIILALNVVGMIILSYFLYKKDNDNLTPCILTTVLESVLVAVLLFGISKSFRDQERELHRYQYDKELLLNTLEKGECGEICIKENWMTTGAPPAIKKFYNCEVIVTICKGN